MSWLAAASVTPDPIAPSALWGCAERSVSRHHRRGENRRDWRGDFLTIARLRSLWFSWGGILQICRTYGARAPIPRAPSERYICRKRRNSLFEPRQGRYIQATRGLILIGFSQCYGLARLLEVGSARHSRKPTTKIPRRRPFP
jgi:hypothetical protein